MLLWLRKVLFYALLITYFFVTPYAVFYALGYIFNPAERELVRTGLISVVTAPKTATIFVQSKKYAHKTPTAVRDLLPGTYHVKITRKGFETWEKDVEILPEKAVQLEPVLLMPQKPERERISNRLFRGMVPGIIESKMFAWEDRNLNSLWKIDLFFRKETSVARDMADGYSILNVFYPRESPIALFLVQEPDGKKFWLLDMTEEKKILRRLSGLPSILPDVVDWDPRNPEQIYFLTSGILSRYDVRRNELEPEMALDVLGFGAKYNRLILLKKDFSLVETDPHGRYPEPLFHDSMLGREIFAPADADYYHIEIPERDLLIFRSDKGALISNRLPYRHVEKGVLGLQYSKRFEQDKLLFWTKREIGIMDFSRDKGNLFEKEPEKVVLFADGKNIRQAFWAYDDTHIVFLDDTTVYVLESRGPLPYEPRMLERVLDESFVDYSDRDHSLYFVDASSGHLMKRKLVD